MGNDEVLHRYVSEFERGQILAEAHGGFLEDIMQVMPQYKRFFVKDYGGQLYVKTRKHTVGLVTYVNGLGNHHGGIKCCSIHR